MSAELEPRLQVEPVITLPERVSPGQVAIVEVGLRVCEPQHWPYAEDSFRFGCMLDGAPDFVVESIDRHDITLTRDGLGDDPIRFAVTAQWSVQGSRSLWLSLTTDHGVVVRTYEIQLPVEPEPRDREPVREGRPESLSTRPATFERRSVTGSTGMSVLVDCEPDGVLPNRYRLSAWIVDAMGNDAVLMERSGPATLTGVRAAAEEAIGWTEQAGILGPQRCRIEFALPRELLDLPVETWHLATGARAGLPLGSRYPVVVRSLDRLRSADSHDTWLQRWNYLVQHADEPTSRAAVWAGPDGSWWSRPVAWREAVCLAFESSVTEYQQAGYEGLDAAVNAGLPVAIWSRDSASASVRSDLWNLLRQSTLGDLPDAVQRLRRQAMAIPPEEPHLGRHVVLLWDDPIRVPRTHPGVGAHHLATTPIAIVLDAHGQSCGTAFFVGPQQLLTSRHVVRDVSDRAWPATVTVEIPQSGGGGLRRVEGVVSSPSTEFDIAVIELSVPVRLGRPPAVEPLHPLAGAEVAIVGPGVHEEPGVVLPGRLVFDPGAQSRIAFQTARSSPSGGWAGFSGGPVISAQGSIVGLVTTVTGGDRLEVVPIAHVARQWIADGWPSTAAEGPSPVRLMNVVDCCLDIPMMSRGQLRQRLVDALPSELSIGLLRHRRDRFDIYGLLSRCASRRHGLDELLSTARSVSDASSTDRLAEAVDVLRPTR